MLSPFTTVDHRIDALPWEERRAARRSSPKRLRFEPPGLAVLPRAVAAAPSPLRQPSRLRIRLGRLLIALGQRLARVEAAS